MAQNAAIQHEHLGHFHQPFRRIVEPRFEQRNLVSVLEDAEVIIQRFVIKLAIPRQISLVEQIGTAQRQRQVQAHKAVEIADIAHVVQIALNVGANVGTEPQHARFSVCNRLHFGKPTLEQMRHNIRHLRHRRKCRARKHLVDEIETAPVQLAEVKGIQIHNPNPPRQRIGNITETVPLNLYKLNQGQVCG